MTDAPTTLTRLAQRFDEIAAHTHRGAATRARRNAAQLRFVATGTLSGIYTTEQAWQWADAAAGQLIDDTKQLERKARK